MGVLLTLSNMREIEVDSTNPLMLAIAYPPGTSFSITANAVFCATNSQYDCVENFQQVSSIAEVRGSAGNTYYFGSDGLLVLRVVQFPQNFVGDTLFSSSPQWHLWDLTTPGRSTEYALRRFSRSGISLPRGAVGPFLRIAADCSRLGAYCSVTPPNVEPDVCSPGYEQASYDKCCIPNDATDCEYSPMPALTTSSLTAPLRLERVINGDFESGNTDGWFPFGNTQLSAVTSPVNGRWQICPSNCRPQ